MDRNLDVRTPESIAFTYQLAGLGSRFLAVVVDQILQVAIVLALILGLSLAASHLPAAAKHVVDSGSTKVAEAIVIALIVVVLFLIFFGYFILFEVLWHGQTPGKKMLGIRVVRDGGYPVDFGAAIVRNLIRVGELIVGYYAISAVCALISPENKRLGDMAAGTIVVRDARLAMPLELLRKTAAEPQNAPSLYLTADERALIKRFLERRDALSRERRTELAAQLAARVRDRAPADLQRLDDEQLLERL
jgi:uncharacterized RDD family membrane protein YckC